MSGFQMLIVLICAGLGFGIVNTMINAARSARGPDEEVPRDPDRAEGRSHLVCAAFFVARSRGVGSAGINIFRMAEFPFASGEPRCARCTQSVGRFLLTPS